MLDHDERSTVDDKESASIMNQIQYNVSTTSDHFRFKGSSRKEAARLIGLHRTVFIPATAITRSITRDDKYLNVIDFSGKKLDQEDFSQHATPVFIEEILIQGKDYRETELYKRTILSSRTLTRATGALGTTERIMVATEADFEKYYQRCMLLAESIRNNGVYDLRSRAGKRFKEDTVENNLGVIVDKHGRFIQRRRGKHRLAIAKALHVESFPVVLDSLSGVHLLKFLSPAEAFLPGRLSGAVKEAVAAAKRRAMAKVPSKQTGA